MQRISEISGYCVQLDLFEPGFCRALNQLSPIVHSRACEALTDFTGRPYVAYDQQSQRAYCFQRRGLHFYYHRWDYIETAAIAKRLFSKLSADPLPIPGDISDRLYRESRATDEQTPFDMG